jgi:ankyrin repeat protein
MWSNRFRWVYCQLEVLRHCFPNNLLRSLQELPKSLDETYQRILKEINNANQKEAHRLLQCLAVASRPLRVEELAEVLALDVDAGGIPTFNEKWRWEDHEAAVLSACSSLVCIINDDSSRVVQFAHFSVKEFLTSDRLTSMGDVSRFHIADEPSHVILAQACFGVLLSLDDDTSKENVIDIPFHKYSSRNWVEHAQVGNVELQIKDAMDCFFDVDRPHLAAFMRVDSPWDDVRVIADSPDGELTGVPSLTPLHLASALGFGNLAKRLIVKRAQVINFSGLLGTPLHLSAQNGHIKVVQLLLAHGADINSRSVDNSTPLHIALQNGHLEIAKWLLKSGADLDSQDESGLTPLLLAASRGHTDICRILLDRNVDVHVRDNRRHTPLHFATSIGHLEISRILLDRDADVNSRDDRGATPLLSALQNGHADVARLLLDHDADAKVCGESGVTPLHLAATNGHFELARILLERGSEINSQDGGGCTPLLIASGNGHADVVRLLLDHNADVHLRSNTGRTPLHRATVKGHVEVSQMLLESNADVNSRTDYGSTPLLLASWYGATDTVQLLLDHNADLDVRDDNGDTPLHRAAIEGRLEVAGFLLKLNVEVNSRNNKGSTPLHLASAGYRAGNPDLVRLLLDHGADAQACNLSGGTASEVARGRRRQEILQLLAERAQAAEYNT